MQCIGDLGLELLSNWQAVGSPCFALLQISCLTGLVEAKVANTTAQGKPKNFDEWIMRVMGEGIANLFMRPYNFKVSVNALCIGLSQREA